MSVTFTDNRANVKSALDNTLDAWLETWANEIASKARRSAALEGDEGIQLRKDYRAVVDKPNKKAQIGSTLESAYWEEFGTGSHADLSKNGGIPGRPMWWVYITNETPRTDNPIYRTEEEAKAVAASWREDGKDAHATNGIEPNYTLENSYLSSKDKAINDLENKVRGALNG